METVIEQKREKIVNAMLDPGKDFGTEEKSIRGKINKVCTLVNSVVPMLIFKFWKLYCGYVHC